MEGHVPIYQDQCRRRGVGILAEKPTTAKPMARRKKSKRSEEEEAYSMYFSLALDTMAGKYTMWRDMYAFTKIKLAAAASS